MHKNILANSLQKTVIITSISGLLLALSFGPFNLNFLAWFSFIPIFFLLDRRKSGFKVGFLFGVFFFLFILYWIPFSNVEPQTRIYIILGFLLLVGYLSVYFGLAFYLYPKMKQKGLILLWPIVFIGIEFFRTLTSNFGFPWGVIGYSQSRMWFLIQFASLGGLPLVGIWVIYLNLFFYQFLKLRLRKYLYIFISLIIIPFVGSIIYVHLYRLPSQKLNVCIVQTDINPDAKRAGYDEYRLEVIDSLIDANSGYDLYVLPESASPCFIFNNINCRSKFENLSRRLKTGIIVGTPEYEFKKDKTVYYNSAAYLEEGILIGKYRKNYLVPFVERFPYNDVIPLFERINLGQGDFFPGRKFSIFNGPGYKFSVPICFEEIFPRVIRRFVRNGANFIVNITEDSWFGKLSGPYQHFDMSVFRAIEYRRAIVRCANTGISGFIDPFGRIVKKTHLFTRDVQSEKIPIVKRMTVYTRIGDLFGWASLAFAVFMFIILRFRKERNKGIDKEKNNQ